MREIVLALGEAKNWTEACIYKDPQLRDGEEVFTARIEWEEHEQD